MTALAEIQDRVRNSMCLTWGADQGERMEARISEADWNEVVKVLEFYAKHEHWISIGEDGPQTVLVAHGDVQGVEMTETELKPCPFCGYALSYDEGICPAKEVEDDEDETDVGIGGICCPSCAVWLPLDKPTPAEAIAAWNRRTPSREAVLEEAAKVAERDVDWTMFARQPKKDWKTGEETNVFAPMDDPDNTIPTPVNVFAYANGIAAGRAIAAAIRSRASEDKPNAALLRALPEDE